ncbi:MAG: hypothetical protein KGL63_01750 [Betaproteobacteria bacterium]|nr:hypothetical protein [Betaproteobacteria bacterium]
MIDFDQLRRDVDAATPGPWSVPHFCDDDAGCNCRYVLGEYGGMGSIAKIGVAENMDGPWGDDFGPAPNQAKANGRLIARAPDLARLALLVPELREALYSVHKTRTMQRDGHLYPDTQEGWEMCADNMRETACAALAKLDALLADIGKEG